MTELKAECERLRGALREVVRKCVCKGKLETMRLVSEWGAPQPMDPCIRPQCLAARRALKLTTEAGAPASNEKETK